MKETLASLAQRLADIKALFDFYWLGILLFFLGLGIGILLNFSFRETKHELLSLAAKRLFDLFIMSVFFLGIGLGVGLLVHRLLWHFSDKSHLGLQSPHFLQ